MGFYIYGIIDPSELPDTVTTLADQLAAVVYVGKGTGSRSESHSAEAIRLLQSEVDSESTDRDYGQKLNRLISLFRAGTPPRSIKLAAGFKDEADAYRVEAFAIESINALRIAAGRSPLTNQVKGHGIAVEPLAQYVSRLEVEPIEVADRHGIGRSAILVKGSNETLRDSVFEIDHAGDLPEPADRMRGRVVAMSRIGDAEPRPAWDIHAPWDDDTARTRARRYWRIALSDVIDWVTDPQTAPECLALAVEEDGRTPVRYVWTVDADGTWEYYGKTDEGHHLWGIPLGDRLVDHPLVDTHPVIGGKQAMHGNSSGIKLIRFDAP